jgi:ATP-dependent Lon protease
MVQEYNNNVENNIDEKLVLYRNLINSTIIANQHYKRLGIISSIDILNCYNYIDEIKGILGRIGTDINENLKNMQDINDIYANLFKNNGTHNFEDFVKICVGSKQIKILQQIDCDKYDVIKQFFHPTSYKILKWKNHENKNNKQLILKKNKIIEDFMIVDCSHSLDCFDLARTSTKFILKTNGIKLSIQCPEKKCTVIICGILDDIYINSMENKYISKVYHDLESSKLTIDDTNTSDYDRFISSLTIKDVLVYNTDELLYKFDGVLSSIKYVQKKEMSHIVNDFLSSTIFEQRKLLINLLIANKSEMQYYSYMLYDLLSNENNETEEQILIYDSFPYYIKTFFKISMKHSLEYSSNLSKTDKNIPLEQQICLMKTDETIKEKAMLKLKEVRFKSDDTGFKARQFLEGLLKIPFNIFKEEPILNYRSNIEKSINKILDSFDFSLLSECTLLELNKVFESRIKEIRKKNTDDLYMKTVSKYTVGTCKSLKQNIRILSKNTNKTLKIQNNKLSLISTIQKTIDTYRNNFAILNKLYYEKDRDNCFSEIENLYCNIDSNINNLQNSIKSINNILDEAVYGHKNAKKQIEKIIGQWISGKPSGYCFGFEGPPGLGKTSIAKRGISKCLVDEDGNNRPFAFIALGGASNGSILDGHNYTYVGSKWGKIVDILMTTKCLNPIIFIDELDKVSCTENGKEIVGILTHLVDATQNDSFQDKYFSGIPINLSRALFIFSYNDPSKIDSILLDRIHRVKFKPLTVYEKVVIVKKYILPEFTKDIQLLDKLLFDDYTILHIIENYTFESGVRKLRQMFFEIINEINIEILKLNTSVTLPYKITVDDIDNKFLCNYDKINHLKIPLEDKVGIINGLWANAYGKGGIIPIECMFYPNKTVFDLKLTGQQGDVMKESMSVARTVAWNYLTQHNFDFDTLKSGIHIHCPEGAVPKDGPSAGLAITLALLSLILKKTIRRDVGITGEINLQGDISIIGGLELKIMGGIKGGIKTFIFPDENTNDLVKFKERYDESVFSGITFIPVKTLIQAMNIIYK